jgi:hypothetical protein
MMQAPRSWHLPLGAVGEAYISLEYVIDNVPYNKIEINFIRYIQIE